MADDLYDRADIVAALKGKVPGQEEVEQASCRENIGRLCPRLPDCLFWRHECCVLRAAEGGVQKVSHVARCDAELQNFQVMGWRDEEISEPEIDRGRSVPARRRNGPY